ncbi:hypothetical protein QUA82_07945, partial [Microcoleus sp. F8-D3]
IAFEPVVEYIKDASFGLGASDCDCHLRKSPNRYNYSGSVSRSSISNRCLCLAENERDYEESLLFFTVLTIIEVILYKSKFL